MAFHFLSGIHLVLNIAADFPVFSCPKGTGEIVSCLNDPEQSLIMLLQAFFLTIHVCLAADVVISFAQILQPFKEPFLVICDDFLKSRFQAASFTVSFLIRFFCRNLVPLS